MAEKRESEVGAGFRAAYAALNPAQKEAVDAIEGPVIVIAGPGTGKTQILALRIANILQRTDVPPGAILALTFTEAGVSSMRARLVKLIGARGYQVRIHTFHGFCNSIIKAYPERFSRIIGSEQMIEIDALHIIEHILDTGSTPLLRPVNKPYLYVRDIKGVISETKRENVSPQELVERIAKEEVSILGVEDLYHAKGAHAGKMKGAYVKALERLKKSKEFAKVYALYEEEIMRRHLYDFEDTILEVVHTMESDEDLTRILQEEHQYLLADEHQDANGAQNRLLELLSDFHESPNLFIVGDEKQAIYRFQGASLENFLYFKKRYPSALQIDLVHNYRSTQVILDAAHTLLQSQGETDGIGRPQLLAQSAHAHVPIALRVAQSYEEELRILMHEIKALQEKDSVASEIAVLCRRNSDVAAVAKILQKNGIAVSSQSDGQILEMPLIRSFVQVLSAVAHFGEQHALYPVLFAPFVDISNLDVYRLTTRIDDRASLWETLASREKLAARGVEGVAECLELFAALDESATFAKGASLPDTIDFILHRCGVLTYIARHSDMQELLEALRALVQYVAQLATAHHAYGIRELLQVLETAAEYRISILPTSLELPGSVRVLTAHKAKGMEYDHVFIPFVHDSVWGVRGTRTMIYVPLFGRDTDSEELSLDERRLLYVAMTRARKTLSLSYAEKGIDGREQIPSRFLADIDSVHLDVVANVPDMTQGAFGVLAPTLSRRENDRAYVRARLAAQGLSVSALNNYLDLPWKYFFQNLLRMPSRKETYQYYGTAMDAALKLFTKKEHDEGFVSAETVIAEFERVLSTMPLRDVDAASFIEKGRAALRGYVAEHSTEGAKEVDAGISFSVPFETGIPELPEITLRGEYDRVEFLDSHTVRVVDFKTGSPKTRGYIEGTTKDSNGNYKRQLVFYALLASLDSARAWHVTEGVIDFVEPDEKGKYHRVPFVISKDDVALLSALLRKTIREIISCEFFDTGCDADAWSEEGCALVHALTERIQKKA